MENLLKTLQQRTSWTWSHTGDHLTTWEFAVTDGARSTSVLIPYKYREDDLTKAIKQLHKYFDFFKGLK